MLNRSINSIPASVRFTFDKTFKRFDKSLQKFTVSYKGLSKSVKRLICLNHSDDLLDRLFKRFIKSFRGTIG